MLYLVWQTWYFLDIHCMPCVQERTWNGTSERIRTISQRSRESRVVLFASRLVVPRSPLPAMSVDPTIVAMLRGLEKTDGRLVSSIDDILQRLLDARMAYQMRIPPKMVGVHPANRGGYGVSAVEVHALGADIVKMGWSPAATAHAVCIEDDESKSIAGFSERLSKSTQGLGVVEASMIKYGSVSCSHTNQFLVAALCGVKSDQESLVVDECISVSKITASDAKLADALNGGLNWLVLSSTVAKLYPTLAELVQYARNATGAAQRNETEMQALSKIQSLVSSSLRSSSESVDWSNIAECVQTRSSIPKAELETLLRFVQLYGGGRDGRFIEDLDKFHKVFVPTGRIVPHTTFGALNDLKLDAADACPFFVIAVVKAQASCHPSKVQNRVCRYISNSDIASLAGNRKGAMLEAEKILRRCRQLVAEVPDQSHILKCLSRLDTLMARFVLTKEAKFASAAEIGASFVCEVNAGISPVHRPIVSPFGDCAKDDRSSSSAPTSSQVVGSNIVEYNAEGVAVGVDRLTLHSAGTIDDTCVYIYLYIYRHTLRRIHTYTHIHTYLHTYIHTYIHTYMHTFLHTYVHTYTQTHNIYIYIYTHMYMYNFRHAAPTSRLHQHETKRLPRRIVGQVGHRRAAQNHEDQPERFRGPCGHRRERPSRPIDNNRAQSVHRKVRVEYRDHRDRAELDPAEVE